MEVFEKLGGGVDLGGKTIRNSNDFGDTASGSASFQGNCLKKSGSFRRTTGDGGLCSKRFGGNGSYDFLMNSEWMLVPPLDSSSPSGRGVIDPGNADCR
jgi:hypothetical protein